ncbi:ammonium transporter [Tribonema minus]|uniref:Ammonium transporter n=1 Tax=Tribonema minus TaxID=303371 RepID=A0A835ZBF4_9STRA|nr:ammonium transporter [Tribonema minus]
MKRDMLPEEEWWLRPVNRVRILSGLSLTIILVLCVLITTVPQGRNGDLELFGPELDALDPADIAWVLIATGLVLLMIGQLFWQPDMPQDVENNTPGVSFFYGGMVRRTSLNTTLLQSFAIMAMVMVLWITIGFSLAYGESVAGGIIGNPSTYYFFNNVGAAPNAALAPTIPLTLFAMFEAAFAILTPALIAGAVVERAHFSALVMFCGIWHLLVYCPIAHCTWAPGGLFRKFGHLDFAGGTVVHMASGYSALTLAKLVGVRLIDNEEKPNEKTAHIPYMMLGTALMWFGWQGFNGGSALQANYNACQAILNTNASAGTCMAVWALWDNVRGRRVTGVSPCGGIVCGLGRRVTGVSLCAGIVCGLVAITPAAGYVTVGGAMLIGAISAIVSNTFIRALRNQRLVDDTVDVFGCHGVAGTCGMILTSIFATNQVNPEDAYDGLVYGSGTLLWHTIVVAAGVIAYCTIMTCLAYTFVGAFIPFRGDVCPFGAHCTIMTSLAHTFVGAIIPFRVTLKQERAGLDASLHGSIHGLSNMINLMLPNNLRPSSQLSNASGGFGGFNGPPVVDDVMDESWRDGTAPGADDMMPANGELAKKRGGSESEGPTPTHNPAGGLSSRGVREGSAAAAPRHKLPSSSAV